MDLGLTVTKLRAKPPLAFAALKEASREFKAQLPTAAFDAIRPEDPLQGAPLPLRFTRSRRRG